MPVAHAFHCISGKALVDIRLECSGAYAIDPNFVPGVFHSSDLGELNDSGLGGPVWRRVSPSCNTCDRGSIHDGPTRFLLTHHLDGRTNTMDRTHQIHTDNAVPLRVWEVVKAAIGVQDSSVIDHDIEASTRLARDIDEFGHFSLRGNVDCDCLCLTTAGIDLLDNAFESCDVQIA